MFTAGAGAVWWHWTLLLNRQVNPEWPKLRFVLNHVPGLVPTLAYAGSSRAASALGLNSVWRMFTPDPSSEDWWVLQVFCAPAHGTRMTATLLNGTR